MGDRKYPTTIYLSEDDRKRLEQLARREQRSVSYYVRQIITEHLKRAGKRAGQKQESESAKA